MLELFFDMCCFHHKRHLSLDERTCVGGQYRWWMVQYYSLGITVDVGWETESDDGCPC